MIRDLSPSCYFDEVYGRGVHAVLLHLGDDLYRDAHAELDRVDIKIGESRSIRLWECCVRTAEDCVAVQACKFPQFRFFVNGKERYTHVGILESSSLLNRICDLEDEP